MYTCITQILVLYGIKEQRERNTCKASFQCSSICEMGQFGNRYVVVTQEKQISRKDRKDGRTSLHRMSGCQTSFVQIMLLIENVW